MKTAKIRMLINILFLGFYFSAFAHSDGNPNLNSAELETSLGTWRYETSGSGMKGLVFIHGENSNSRIWKNQRLLKIQEFKNIYINLLGYGNSDKPAYGYSMANWLDGIRKIVAQEKLQTVVLVAHGYGAFIAKAFQAKYPNAIKRLILINDVFENQGNQAILHPGRNRDLEGELSKLDTGASGYDIKPGPLSKEIHSTVQWQNSDHFKINCPVLMIHGESNGISNKNKRKLKRSIPRLSLVAFEDIGYSSPMENPLKINALIAKHTLLVIPT
ncbi:MAG: alpha/beta hydrolase [Bacteroidota bacterium]